MATDGSGREGARIAFVGDLMLARKISAALLAGRPPASFFGDILPELRAADAVIGNLECALSRRRRHVLKAYHFRADPEAVAILAAGNVRCVALANNHVLDAGPEGLADTLASLDRAGIAHAGAGGERRAAFAPAMLRIGGLKVGFVSLTNTLGAFRAGTGRPGTAFIKVRADAAVAGLLADLAGAVKRGGADLAILSLHWGPNLRPWPPRRYRQFAHRAIDAGFDVVHGHSAHVLQPVEYYRGRPILYDTGDFLDDYWIMPGFRIDRSFLFQLTAARNRPPRLRLTPVTAGGGIVRRAEGREAAAIREGMIRRCRAYQVEFAAEGDALLVVPKTDHDETVGPPARSIASASRTA
jgi:poly-gamma-glutamate synthesis protein (capsule biosynthesis protein)